MQYRSKVACIFLLGFFLDCINIFMSAIAFPAMSTLFKLNRVEVAWIANIYILGLTLIIPLSSWLANILNVRRALLYSVGLFTLATFMVGFADSFSSLLFWRFIQGLSGGLLIPIGQALTFNLYQGGDRIKISTVIMMVALIAPALSPMLGGWIVDLSSWRWIFYSHIPFAALLFILVYYWLEPEYLTQQQRPDYLGMLFIALALVALLMSLTLMGELTHPYLLILFVLLTALFSAGYIYYARHRIDPVIQLSLLKNTKLQLSILVYLAVPGVFTGVNLLAIFFLQDVLQFSAAETGSFMLLYALMALSAMLLTKKYYLKWGAKKLFYLGVVIHSLGIYLLARLETGSSISSVAMAYLCTGFGGGLAANTAQATALLDFTKEQMAQASVIWNINRQVSFSLGAAFFLMLFNLFQHFSDLDLLGNYQLSFICAAVLGCMPLLFLHRLKEQSHVIKC